MEKQADTDCSSSSAYPKSYQGFLNFASLVTHQSILFPENKNLKFTMNYLHRGKQFFCTCQPVQFLCLLNQAYFSC